MTKKKKTSKASPASYEVPGRGRRVQITFTEPGLTRGSFKDECDINNIVKRFTQTGVITHVRKSGPPQYGDAPDQTFYESACIAAEAASALEDGLPEPEPTDEAPEASEDVLEDVTGSAPETDQKPLQNGSNDDAEASV